MPVIFRKEEVGPAASCHNEGARLCMKAYTFDILLQTHTPDCPASCAVIGSRIQLRDIDETLYEYQ